MDGIPQVALFGVIGGGWREALIPFLQAHGISYYNPLDHGEWTPAHGTCEAEVMAGCETIVMVFNDSSPSFAGLAEAGWAALGAQVRGQHFILYVGPGPAWELPAALMQHEEVARFKTHLEHWTTASRDLVQKHARAFDLDGLHIVDDLDGVADALRAIYAPDTR